MISALAIFASTEAASAQPAPAPAAPQFAPSAHAIFNPYPVVSPSPNPPPRYLVQSPISPYLNLLRGGDPATNYYLNVVPLLQAQKKQEQVAGADSPLAETARKLDEEAREISLRRSAAGNLPTFGNYYGGYSLPNQRSYIPYNPVATGGVGPGSPYVPPAAAPLVR